MSQKEIQNNEELNVVETLSKTEAWLNKNKKNFMYTIAGIIIIVALFFAYHNFIVVPKQKEAQNQMFTAERYFRLDSFKLALNGDGNALGFLKVIDKYGRRAPEAAYFYAGVSFLQLGGNDEAIKYLKKYSSKDKIMAARAKANIGDALVNKGDIKNAIGSFKEAATLSNNLLSAGYLFKAALCYEELGQKEEALALYEKIKNEYSASPEGVEIDKYISRLK